MGENRRRKRPDRKRTKRKRLDLRRRKVGRSSAIFITLYSTREFHRGNRCNKNRQRNQRTQKGRKEISFLRPVNHETNQKRKKTTTIPCGSETDQNASEQHKMTLRTHRKQIHVNQRPF